MAAGAEEKTEQPTAKKKGDARKKGNIPKSRDLSAALMLLAAIKTLEYVGPYMAERIRDFTVKIIHEDMPNLSIPVRQEIIPYAMGWVLWLVYILAPYMLLVTVAAYVVNYIQVGWLITTQPLKINLSKLNPVSGLKRLFSTRNLVMLVMNLAKMFVIMGVAWSTVYFEVQNVLVMLDMETAGTFLWTTERVLGLAERLAILLMALGIADFYYQKWKNNKDLKMTKQEVKEEFKQMEGDPKVKQKRRQKQMEMAMQRMMQEVPQAEVVVRNPTHFAVAISYKPGMAAPVVVAKGKDRSAERIIEAAREHRIPMVENPPLARELYRKVEIGDEIPEELFATVAEILSSVMDAEKKRKMMESLTSDAA